MSSRIDKVGELLGSHKYLQLSASWCPDCVYANKLWDKLGVKSKLFIFDIAQQSDNKSEEAEWRSAFQQVTGSRNLPTIFVDGKFWGTERELHKYEKEGTLEQELKAIGLLIG